MDIAGPNSLIRLLRSPQDPPSPDGPSKIAIARRVWSDSSDIPGKADIIRDWIYSVWEKESKGPATRVSFDNAHLDLLASILSFTSQALPTHSLSLYFRTLSSAAQRSKLGSHELWRDGARRCVASSDAWVEVWVEMMKYLGEDGSSLDMDLVRVIEAKVGESIVLMPISKKNSLAVQSTLTDISKAFAQHTFLDTDILGSVLFPVSSLRIAKTALSLLEALPSAKSTLQFIPRLLCALESSVRNHRYDVFIQPTSSKTPYQTYTNAKVRSFLCSATSEVQGMLLSIGVGLAECDLWSCRRRIWENVDTWGLYVETDHNWKNLLVLDIEKAKGLLRGHPDTVTVGEILSFLTIAEGLDHATTNVEEDTMAWCLASPSPVKIQAEGMLSAICRYHRLSQSPETWVTLVLASVEQLLAVSGALEAKLSIHGLIIHGPLFGDGVWHQLRTIKKTDGIVEGLISRVQTITSLDISTAITLDIISYLAIALCADNERSITSLVGAMEALLQPVKSKRRDTSFELSLAALVRLGRNSTPDTRARLDSEFDLVAATGKASSSELRDETCQWLVARIGDAPDQSEDLLDSLVAAARKSVAQACWDTLDREGLSAIEHSATTKQLDSLFAARAESELQWLLSSAETVEMPRVLSAILKATLTRMSKGPSSGSMFALLASLPSTVLDDDARQAIVDGAQTSESLADPERTCIIRQALAHLIRGSSTKVNLAYWATLQADAAGNAHVNVYTRELIKAFIEVALDSESELDRLLTRLSNDTARTCAAEVAVAHDAARVATKVQARLSKMVDQMADAQSQASPADTLLTIRKLRQWCDGTVVISNLPLQLADCSRLGPAELELLRLHCDGPLLLEFLQLLMSRSNAISSETLHREIVELANKTTDLVPVIGCCLRWIAARDDFEKAGGYAVLAELLSIRRQGSGKAILQCRETLLDTMLDVPGVPSNAQLSAIKAFVRLRSKLLRVSDVSRIIATISSSPNAMAIDIVHAAVLTRSDLVVHVLPILARFLCNSFDSIKDTSAISLSRLLSTFGNRRSAKSTRDANLALPFSKHAPAVLVAYVRSVTRPNNALAIATRRTLQMSVYTLCDAVIRSQDRGREGEGIGTPYGLGETGEAEQEIWADLWKQWAKQRYKGQG